MALLKTKTNQAEVVDGESVGHAAKTLGVTLGCQKGVCGACVAIVVEGAEFLSPKSENEENYDLREGDRMMCQCKANGGTILIQI